MMAIPRGFAEMSQGNRAQEMQLLGMGSVPRRGGVGQAHAATPLLNKSQSLQTINELGRAPTFDMDLVPRRQSARGLSPGSPGRAAAGGLRGERRQPDMSPILRQTSIEHQASRRQAFSRSPSPRAHNLCSHLTSLSQAVKSIGRQASPSNCRRARSHERMDIADVPCEILTVADRMAFSRRRQYGYGHGKVSKGPAYKEDKDASDDDVSTEAATTSCAGSDPAATPPSGSRDDGEDSVIGQGLARLFEARMQELTLKDLQVSRMSSFSSNAGTSAPSFISCRQVLSPRGATQHLHWRGGIFS
eukprot:TRINITY_DN2220_c0_g1_i1.p1 TRINITY_DN2220_c0_g1~~TRINITY_DN2220_c0_g1_i1.p1  ORF type:complete len:303 (+),score=50.58 TRINITY_DN2220_c0_g1_i1:96-1004(+)